MPISTGHRPAGAPLSWAILSQHAMTSVLTRSDRRALVGHIPLADKVGAGASAMLARLLGLKFLYATVLDHGRIDSNIAAGGSRVTYAIDDHEPQSGRLFHHDELAAEDGDIHVGSLLGATLIGMTAGTRGPFLQADGSFRCVYLLGVENPGAERRI